MYSRTFGGSRMAIGLYEGWGCGISSVGRLGAEGAGAQPRHRDVRRRQRVLPRVGHRPASRRRRGSSTSASTPASTCSTPPTSTRAACRRRSSARPSPAGAHGRSSPPRRRSAWATGPNDLGSSRHHLLDACDASLRRLGTDYIDIYQLHGFDAVAPIEEALRALDDLVRAGKVRYIGCSNFSGWHLMKSLAVADRYGWTRYVAHQAYYSLLSREYEWELMPLAIDQRIGTIVWSPLGWGRLDRQAASRPARARREPPAEDADNGPPVADEHLYRIVDAIDEVAKETGEERAADRAQLAAAAADRGQRHRRRAQRGSSCERTSQAVGWNLTAEQVARLDAASAVTPIYPYWHQRAEFGDRNPPPVLGSAPGCRLQEPGSRARSSGSGVGRGRASGSGSRRSRPEPEPRSLFRPHHSYRSAVIGSTATRGARG